MEILAALIDLALHLDRHLAQLLADYGNWVYGILFLVVFAETGLVVTPFLPGDSLLFVSGALAAGGGLDVGTLMLLLFIAAVAGDGVNYAAGRHFGPRVFRWEDSRFFNRAALLATQAFYERHGGKTVVIARFLPLIRTFAPFVAGVGSMRYARFAFFNVAGALLWVGSLCLAGYWFGNLPWVRANLTLVIVAIILVSLVPVFWGWLNHRRGAKPDLP